MQNFRKAFLVNVLILVGSLMVLSGVLYWLSTNIDAVAIKIAADQDMIQKRSGTVSNLADLKATIPIAQKYQSSMDLLLPTKDHLIDFPRWLDTLARNHKISLNFTFQSDQVAPSETTPGFTRFSLDVNGALSDVRAFSEDIELRSGKFLAQLDTFDINKVGDNQYHAVMNGRVFFK